MRTPYFTTSERITALEQCARQWLGTPWCANSQAPGLRGGVSCHNLPRAILMECGALPADFPAIIGDPTQTRHSRQSVIQPWLNSRLHEFSMNSTADALRPGDLIGLRIYHCVDHLGLMLPDEVSGRAGVSASRFIHVLMHKKTCVDSLADPTWRSRLLDVWRPLEISDLRSQISISCHRDTEAPRQPI